MVTDPDAVARFTALYDELYPRVHAYAAGRAGREAAEEVAAETFCVAWRRFADLPDPPLPWLLGTARNLVRESHRAEARRASLTASLRSLAPGPEPDVGEAVTERSAVLRGLAALSEDDRELLTLVAWHGLTAAEAAVVVGCSKATFFVRLHRARRRLERAVAASSSHLQPTPTELSR